MLCQKQVSRAGTINFIPRYGWDVATCIYHLYLVLAQHSSNMKHLVPRYTQIVNTYCARKSSNIMENREIIICTLQMQLITACFSQLESTLPKALFRPFCVDFKLLIVQMHCILFLQMSWSQMVLGHQRTQSWLQCYTHFPWNLFVFNWFWTPIFDQMTPSK